jgi:hypothetical protein
LGLLALALVACSGAGGEGEQDDSAPIPTLARLEDLATARAGATATTAPPTETPVPAPALTTPAPVIALASATPTLLPSATSTPSATPTIPPTATATPTALSTAALGATGIALTNTAAAGVLPFTQTAVAVIGATQTARARITPTNTPAPPPDEPYQVVFASDASGSYQIYLLRLDGSEPVALTTSAGMNFAPVFSPDGTQIAFVSTRDGGVPTVWVMHADGSGQHQVTTELGRDTSPSWSADGRQLLYSSEQFGPWNIFLTVIGDDVEGEFPVLPPEFSEANQLWPVFDPTGERIAYTVWPDLNDPQTADIWLLDFEQPEPVAIRAGEGADIAWDWGDDTHLLASVGGPDDVQIALVDVTSGEAIRLTSAGRFNSGARLCVVQPEGLPPEPTVASSPTAGAG